MVCSVLACVGSYFIYNNFFSENGQTVAAGQISQILQTTPITAAPTLQEPEATQPSIDINYVTITDSSNSLVMDVPETWGDINGIPQAGLDGFNPLHIPFKEIQPLIFSEVVSGFGLSFYPTDNCIQVRQVNKLEPHPEVLGHRANPDRP